MKETHLSGLASVSVVVASIDGKRWLSAKVPWSRSLRRAEGAPTNPCTPPPPPPSAAVATAATSSLLFAPIVGSALMGLLQELLRKL